MGYDFRLAKNNEIDTIYSLYEKRIQWMDHTGIQQWNTTNYLAVYPISYYTERQKSEELQRWMKEAHSPAFYVHNLVTEPSIKGAGKIILSEAEKVASSKGMKFIRLDCAVDNEFLNEYYDLMGYKLVGHCADGHYIGNKREKEFHC